MNSSYPLPTVPPITHQYTFSTPSLTIHTQQFLKALSYTLIPTELLYFSIYFRLKGLHKLYQYLTFLSLGAFWISPYVAPISCGAVKCLQNFAIAIGTMKLLDMYARSKSPPKHTAGKTPADWLVALKLLTELRYESFTPNSIRVSKDHETVKESLYLIVHMAAFIFLQALPQEYPTIQAFEVQLSIYIIFTSLQLLLRYKNSPALFGPLYKADSLAGFWSDTWHNVFASPCASLVYGPLRKNLPKYRVSPSIARSLGVVGAFTLMAVFHMYALSPLLSPEGLKRTGLFFFLNGVGTVSEAMVWGRKKHWARAILAWMFEVAISSWTAAGIDLPMGVSKIPWDGMCSGK